MLISRPTRCGSGVKDHYFLSQHRKCAYCERTLTDWGDVEHFRPKSAIFKLRSAGRERANVNNVEGRVFWSAKDGAPGTWD